MSLVENFLDECCLDTENGTTPSAQLYITFVYYCLHYSHLVIDQQQFLDEMRRLGYRLGRTAEGVEVFGGLLLLPVYRSLVK